MTVLKINREFFVRHLAVALLMFGLGCWFGYDGYVAYPQQPDSFFAERHLKRESAIHRQKEFMVLAFLAALAVGGHLAWVASLRFAYDDTEFECAGRRRKIADVKSVDWSKWAKKGIVKVDGITLDAWHHVGVREFAEKLPK